MRLLSVGLLFALVLAFTCAFTGPGGRQDRDDSDPALPRGTIVGHLGIPEEVELDPGSLIVLMPPLWSERWNSAVQRRLDLYFHGNRGAVARNPDVYAQVAAQAYRDATNILISEMREEMGGYFSGWVRSISDASQFEFAELPFGEYRIIALANTAGDALIWSQTVRVSSPVPLYIEVRNRIP